METETFKINKTFRLKKLGWFRRLRDWWAFRRFQRSGKMEWFTEELSRAIEIRFQAGITASKRTAASWQQVDPLKVGLATKKQYTTSAEQSALMLQKMAAGLKIPPEMLDPVHKNFQKRKNIEK